MQQQMALMSKHPKKTYLVDFAVVKAVIIAQTLLVTFIIK